MRESEGGFGEVVYVTEKELDLLGEEVCKAYCEHDCECGYVDVCALNKKEKHYD